MKTSGQTHIGRMRKSNQDNFFIGEYENFTVLAVADGMGGHNGGEFASEMAVESVKEFFGTQPESDIFSDSACITNFFRTLNKIIYHKSVQDENLRGMGTTLTLALINESVAIIFHVGDSRAYLVHKDGGMYQITKDHSLVQYMIDTNQISPQQAKTHPNRNIITRAVGTESPLDVDVFVVSMAQGDRLLLCSDGLTNMIDDDEISFIIRTNDIDSAVGRLITRANEEGGVDNITAVLCEG